MKIVLTIAVLVICIAAQAQMRKCTGADGKITYSDVLCTNASVETGVSNRVSNMEMPGLRQGADMIRQDKARASTDQMMANPPMECKFKSFAYNDEKGKLLADKAQLECVKNIQAAKEGRPALRDDYSLWKDHYDQTSSSRQAAANRAVSSINAANKPMPVVGISRDITCKPNVLGTALNCN